MVASACVGADVKSFISDVGQNTSMTRVDESSSTVKISRCLLAATLRLEAKCVHIMNITFKKKEEKKKKKERQCTYPL